MAPDPVGRRAGSSLSSLHSPSNTVSIQHSPAGPSSTHESMTEEYDPDGFSLRISPSLFQVLSGRAAEPGPIEPRTPREASLIEAVRKEGRRERAAMFSEVKKAQLKEAHELEQAERLALVKSGKVLEDKLAKLNFPTKGPRTLPCASFRDAITVCYKVNGKDNPLACVAQVEAFTECAKQLSRINN